MTKKVRRLFDGFQPTHYQLTIHPNRDAMTLSGEVTITGQRRGRPSQRLTFHQNGIKVTGGQIFRHDKKAGKQAVSVSRINHQKSLQEVRLHADSLLYAGEYTITMQFEGKITDAMHGVYPCYYELDDKKTALIATQFESHHAREAFPCIDEPEAKASFDLTLISPLNEAALSNTPVKIQTEKEGKLHTTFETTPKMSTYLLAFVYGDMQHATTKTKDGVDVRVWSTKVHDPASLDFALDTSVRAIEFFNDYYGVPYPLAKCDHVALPDFSSGAMENWGLITYREVCLLAHPKTTPQSAREFVAMIVCHELSHQWFGNLVTMKWWDDLWLNESFANVMEYLAPAHLIPEWRFWDGFVVNEGLSALRRDAIAGVQPVKVAVHHPDEIATLFDPSIVYAKGGRLINMLVHYLGEDAFRAGLKAYFTAHAYSNTTGDDLWAALSKSSNQDVAGFMNPWLTRSGFPVITVEQTDKKLTVTQSHFLLDPTKTDADRLWPVPLLSDVADMPALLEAKSKEVSLVNDTFVRLNQGAVGHYIVHYKNAKHAASIAEAAAAKELDAPERLMLLNDSSLLARAGIETFAQTLELLEHYVKEDSEPVWDMMAVIISDSRRFIDANPAIEPSIKAFLRQLIEAQYQTLGWTEKPDESAQQTKLRATIIGLGIYAEHPEITKQALALFEKYKTDEHAVPAELRGIVLGAAVRNKAANAFEYLLKLEETTTNVDLKQDIIGALTLTRDQVQIDKLLSRLKDASKVRPQDLDRQLVYLLRNRYAQVSAWQWIKDNWPWIEQTFSGDKSYDAIPRYTASCFNTHQLLEEYTAFFEPLVDQPALTRNITLGIEELANRIKWLERDLAGVQTFFDQFK